jgi:hypothetical protein
MINLIGGSIARKWESQKQNIGFLTSPRQNNHPKQAYERGMLWGMDNDCFVSYDAAAILKSLDKWRGIPGCVFANAPDVVRQHEPTLTMFWYWQPIIAAFGYPVAFTLQNGVTLDSVPFDYCDALFIGGDNEFKFSPLVRSIVAEAKKRGKWVHNGRVNSAVRIVYSRAIGCDSFDGTGYLIEPDKIRQHLPYHSGSMYQRLLWED